MTSEEAISAFHTVHTPDVVEALDARQSIAMAASWPAGFVALAHADGITSYRNKLFRTLCPISESLVADWWYPGSVGLMVSSFGDLIIWTGQSVQVVRIQRARIHPGPDSDTFFLGSSLIREEFWTQIFRPDHHSRAEQMCGVLGPGEIYTWVPAFPLGGSETTSAIQRGKMIEHLHLLAQATGRARAPASWPKSPTGG